MLTRSLKRQKRKHDRLCALEKIPSDVWDSGVVAFLNSKDCWSLLNCSKTLLGMTGRQVMWKNDRQNNLFHNKLFENIITKLQINTLPKPGDWELFPPTLRDLCISSRQALPSNWCKQLKNLRNLELFDLTTEVLPEGLASLKICHLCLEDHRSDRFPRSLKSLEIKYNPDWSVIDQHKKLSMDLCLEGLKELYIIRWPLSHISIPSSLLKLHVKVKSQTSLDSLLQKMSKLKELKLIIDFDCKFNTNCLPAGLEVLELEGIYMTPTLEEPKIQFTPDSKCFPNSLKKFSLRGYCKYAFQKGIFNQNIQEVILDFNFSSPIDTRKEFPPSIEKLSLGYNYNYPLKLGHLTKMRSFNLPENFNQPLLSNDLPPNLLSLDMNYVFNHPISQCLSPLKHLTRLKLSSCFTQFLNPGDIPATVLELNMGQFWNHCLRPGIIPNRTRKLTLSHGFNTALPYNSLPSTGHLRELIFGHDFNQKLKKGDIPMGVTRVHLGYLFNSSIEHGAFPPTLQELTLGVSFNQPLLPGVLPAGIKILKFGKNFTRRLSPGVIPTGVEELSISNTH